MGRHAIGGIGICGRIESGQRPRQRCHERGITRIAEFPNAGLLITASAPANVHRQLILGLAERHRLPAVYPYRYFVVAGGLACYGPDTIGQYRRAAGYVDRILKGESR